MSRRLMRIEMLILICKHIIKRSCNITQILSLALPLLTAKFKLVRISKSLASVISLRVKKQCQQTIRIYFYKMALLFIQQLHCIQITLEQAFLMFLTQNSSHTYEPKTHLRKLRMRILAIILQSIKISKKMLNLKSLITYINKWKFNIKQGI